LRICGGYISWLADWTQGQLSLTDLLCLENAHYWSEGWGTCDMLPPPSAPRGSWTVGGEDRVAMTGDSLECVSVGPLGHLALTEYS